MRELTFPLARPRPVPQASPTLTTCLFGADAVMAAELRTVLLDSHLSRAGRARNPALAEEGNGKEGLIPATGSCGGSG